MAKKAGGIENSKAWKAFLDTPHQARWRNRVTLRYDRAGVPVAPESSTAPAIYAALIRSAAENGTEYGGTDFLRRHAVLQDREPRCGACSTALPKPCSAAV